MVPQEMELFVARDEKEAGVSSVRIGILQAKSCPSPLINCHGNAALCTRSKERSPSNHGLDVDRDAGQRRAAKWLSGGGTAI